MSTREGVPVWDTCPAFAALGLTPGLSARPAPNIVSDKNSVMHTHAQHQHLAGAGLPKWRCSEIGKLISEWVTKGLQHQ